MQPDERSRYAVFRGLFGRGVYPFQAAFLLLNPLRRLILSPAQLAERLGLVRTSRVLELGTGPGYFSPTIARCVAAGLWVGFDLQRPMLQMARRRVARHTNAHGGVVQGDGLRLPFAPGSFDVVFLVAVLGEVPDPAMCLRGCRRLLVPGGRLSITEQPGDPDALSPEELRALTAREAFVFESVHGRGKSFTLNFRRLDSAT